MKGKKIRQQQRGFTLIELLVVIVLLGVLGIAVIPRFVDLRTDAEAANAVSIIGQVQGGIRLFHVDPRRGNLQDYPQGSAGSAANGHLDNVGTNVDCGDTTTQRCFEHVLAEGQSVTDERWRKTSAAVGSASYRDPVGRVWNYSRDTGRFTCTEPSGAEADCPDA